MCPISREICCHTELWRREYVWVTCGDKRNSVSQCGAKLAEVISEGGVLILHGELSEALANAVMVHNVIQSQEHEPEAVHEGTLYNWHTRFGHQSYEAIVALAAKPGSGIKLTDRERPNCMTCTKGKRRATSLRKIAV
jgi:hypothetical protein